MIPTFIIDWPVLILIGMIFGYGVKGSPAGSVMRTRAYFSGKIIVTLFVVLVYYSYLLAPDWMWMYFVRASEVPHWLVFYVLILYYFAYDVGFFLKFELAKINTIYPILLIIVMLLGSIGVTLALKERYLLVGTIDEFQIGVAVPLAQSAVSRIPGTLTLFLLPLAVFLLMWSRRQKMSLLL